MARNLKEFLECPWAELKTLRSSHSLTAALNFSSKIDLAHTRHGAASLKLCSVRLHARSEFAEWQKRLDIDGNEEVGTSFGS